MLKKQLKLLDVYAISTGTTLSAGFFLLPGIAAAQAGSAMIFAYIIAALVIVPPMFSIVELATAMPRAGGVYYFIDRALGPLAGTIGGIGTWMALILKVSFALIGMGAYIEMFFPGLPIVPVAVSFAIIIGVINIYGTKKSGRLQIFLVAGLLLILIYFIALGFPEINKIHFKGIFDTGFSPVLATAGLVYISYVGVTKVASLSEEVQNPERNLPLGIFLSLGTAFIIYTLGTIVMVGVLPIEQLAGDLTPVASAAEKIFGRSGTILVSIAALLAFVSVANAGTLSASRYPLAMSRDKIFPQLFNKISKHGTPIVAIILTVFIIITLLIIFDPTKIAKLASAFQLLMFALVCLSVIIMRESKIDSYDPGFKSPFYPYMQIIGVLASLTLIFLMGWLPIIFTLSFVILGTLWYWYYAKDKVIRNGAIYHIFERLGKARYTGLDIELRGILKEKGLRAEDPFDHIVARSYVIDLKQKAEFEEVVNIASQWFCKFVNHSAEEITELFLEGTRIGATPVTHGIALPHLRLKGFKRTEMVLVRCVEGVHIKLNNPLTDFKEENKIVTAVFFLVSPESDPAQHLRILAQIAGRVDQDSFIVDWNLAQDDHGIREAILNEDRYMFLEIGKDENTDNIIGQQINKLDIPEGCLVIWLRRDDQILIPRSNTIIKRDDRLTIIGDQEGMKKLKERFSTK
ncbi:MAG TPA: amino acid permease [Ignavibacteria bacterium]|nr:amino acid permease [Ignavibacteria bacterium]